MTEREQLLEDLLRGVLDFREGNGTYDFSNLLGQARTDAVMDAWSELESQIREALSEEGA